VTPAQSDMEAERRRLRYENAVLANNLHWAKRTFQIIDREDCASGIDRLQERYGLPPVEDYLGPEAHLTIRRGPE
jgi:hypothetical protein